MKEGEDKSRMSIFTTREMSDSVLWSVELVCSRMNAEVGGGRKVGSERRGKSGTYQKKDV